MNDSDNFALVPKPPGALEKAKPGAERILSGMVADTLALVKKESPRKTRPPRIVLMNSELGPLHAWEIVIRHSYIDAELVLFQDSTEAWQDLSQEGPDLLITGTWFPKARAKEIVERLVDRKAAYPIIVMSAFEPEEQWVREFANRGVNVRFLGIPFTIEDFGKLLAASLKTPPEESHEP